MTCSSCEARFERFLDAELTARERASVVRHVDRCEDCRAMLEELRVVDALLLTPRTIQLAPNFSFSTMAEVRALPKPRRMRAHLIAFLTAYVTAAWLLAGAAFILSPHQMRAGGETTLDVVTAMLTAFGGVAHVLSRAFVRGNTDFSTLIGGLIVGDLAVAILAVTAIAFLRPRLAGRLHS